MEDSSVSVLPIYLYEHSLLRKKAKPIKRPDAHVSRIADDMLETMHKASGIGLAANQVGLLQRIIVVDLSGTEEDTEFAPLVLINPEVVEESGRLSMEEGCLSIPDIREEVERPEEIAVRFRNLDFDEQHLETGGLLARVILHEIDHLDGILFVDRIGAVKRKLFRGRLNKLRRGEVEVGYPIVSEAEPVLVAK
jgi:peptide deformylase